jgi:MFS family permease
MPVFYAEKLIEAQEMGMIGALAIAMVIIGALVVARWLHHLSTRHLLMLGGGLAVLAAGLLLLGVIGDNLPLIVGAYVFLGLMSGLSMSGANAVSADVTSRGNRFGQLAKQSMVVDIIRITFPLAVTGLVILWGPVGGAALAVFSALLLCLVASGLPRVAKAPVAALEGGLKWGLLRNRKFRRILLIESLDSLASSELFVFLPLVLLAKGYDIGSSLLLQSFLFLGYLSGRWFVGRLARRYSGFRAVGYAEVGMVVSIVLLLSVSQLWLLYLLSFALGIFARGTSPAIKALAFDSVDDHQAKQASAIYVVAGDTGSASAQLSFGFLVAWLGANAPFILAATVAGSVAVLCLIWSHTGAWLRAASQRAKSA